MNKYHHAALMFALTGIGFAIAEGKGIPFYCLELFALSSSFIGFIKK
jgi:hypothetical protein